jgi:hypothetical protein
LNNYFFGDVLLFLPFDTIPAAWLNIQFPRNDSFDDQSSVPGYDLFQQVITSDLVCLVKESPQQQIDLSCYFSCHAIKAHKTRMLDRYASLK